MWKARDKETLGPRGGEEKKIGPARKSSFGTFSARPTKSAQSVWIRAERVFIQANYVTPRCNSGMMERTVRLFKGRKKPCPREWLTFSRANFGPCRVGDFQVGGDTGPRVCAETSIEDEECLTAMSWTEFRIWDDSFSGDCFERKNYLGLGLGARNCLMSFGACKLISEFGRWVLFCDWNVSDEECMYECIFSAKLKILRPEKCNKRNVGTNVNSELRGKDMENFERFRVKSHELTLWSWWQTLTFISYKL